MIPDDSAFCDQCGKELKWCPVCKRPKRGTECPVCGSEQLVGNGWRLTLKPGDFGRGGGIWPELASCQYVSGRHGRVTGQAGGWRIVDVGSTNGTFVNGRRLAAGEECALKRGDKIRIATLDFSVE